MTQHRKLNNKQGYIKGKTDPAAHVALVMGFYVITNGKIGVTRYIFVNRKAFKHGAL